MKGFSPRAVFLPPLLLALVFCLASCGGSSSAPTGREAKAESGRELVEQATLRSIRSGWLEARFALDNETKGEEVEWSVLSPFAGLDERRGPEVNAHFEGSGIYDGQITREAGRLTILLGGTALRQNGTVRTLRGALQDANDVGCESGLKAIHVGDLLEEVRSKPIPNSEATVVEAKLDLPAFLSAVGDLSKTSTCGGLLREAGVSLAALKALEAEVRDTFEKSEASFTIGKGHVLERLVLEIWVKSAPPTTEEVDGRLEVNLSRLNEIDSVAGPAARKTALHGKHLGAGQRRSLEAGAALLRALLHPLGAGPSGESHE